MSGYIGKTTNLQRDVVGTQTQSERLDQWGEIDGKIVSFDAEKQTATVQPLYTPRHNGQPVQMPELLEVPVRFARAGKGGMTYPVGAGDLVTLRPKMRSSENYHVDGSGEASDARSFNLSDMEAHLDGGESLQDPIKNFDPANVHVRFDDDGQFGIKGSKDGKVSIVGSEGNIYTLIRDAVDLARETAQLLSTEPGLIHTDQYGDIASSLEQIADKLSGMAL